METESSASLRRGVGLVHWLLGALLLSMLPGCGGCTSDEPPPPVQKVKAKPKPDFEPLKLSVLPDETDAPIRAVKPGHWVSAVLETKANNYDFSGQLRGALVTNRGALVELERMPFRLDVLRDASLPKGQTKLLELSFFVPRGYGATGLSCQLLQGRSGSQVGPEERLPLTYMPAHQYHWFVMAASPLSYQFLTRLDSVRPPLSDFDAGAALENNFYRIMAPRIDTSRTALPSQSLAWTSVAYILWDEIHPTALSPQQQQALVDWLYWGGQLIVSGPKTLDLLKGTFLEPYMPALSGGTLNLEPSHLAELSESWTVPGVNSKPLEVIKPWIGVQLKKQPDAAFLPGTGRLVAERRVGRGRIVVSAFKLDQRQLRTWQSYDSFVNACLLRRPHRRFNETTFGSTVVEWADMPRRRLDPRLVSNLRYFTRDAEEFDEEASAKPAPTIDPSLQDPNVVESTSNLDSGVAGWRDFGPVSVAARQSLKTAAGIVIPRRQFVLQVLVAYLVILVPVNWALFKALGRVEWAWFAAPWIAIAGAMIVIWLAQLDIGFARSRNEIAVIELQGGYPRAHVTRYTALYTSLSTSYDLEFDDPSSLVQPFSADVAYTLLPQNRTVTFRRDPKVQLTGLDVPSNTTQMVHSEHMWDFGGALIIDNLADGRQRVTNGTTLNLSSAAIVRKQPSGLIEASFVGELPPGGEAMLEFSLDKTPLERQVSAIASAAAKIPQKQTFSLLRLVELAEQMHDLGAQDTRLVALTSDELPGVRIEPVASQMRQLGLVVANLKYGQLSQPQPDVNLHRMPTPLPEDELPPEY